MGSFRGFLIHFLLLDRGGETEGLLCRRPGILGYYCYYFRGVRKCWAPLKTNPNLKALIRKFGLSILPEMAGLIIGFQLAETQSITAAINHPAAITPLMHPHFSNISFAAFPICACEDTSSVGDAVGGWSCALSALKVVGSHPSSGFWVFGAECAAFGAAFREDFPPLTHVSHTEKKLHR